MIVDKLKEQTGSLTKDLSKSKVSLSDAVAEAGKHY